MTAQPSDPQSPSQSSFDSPPFDFWQSLPTSLAEMDASLRQMPQQTEQLWQQALASWQLQWGGIPQQIQQRLQGALTQAHHSHDLEHLEAEVSVAAHSLPASQLEVVVRSLPRADHRALLACLFHQLALHSPEADFDREALAQTSARLYGTSGLPIVADAEGSIQVEMSAALLSAVVAIELSSASAWSALQLLGTPEIRRLLKAAGEMRRAALKQGQMAFATNEWQILQVLLSAPQPPTQDWYLSATQVGVQAAQVAEFVGLRMRELLNSGWLGLIPLPLPFHLVIDGLRLLTGDLMLTLGTSMESVLDGAGSLRRIELVLQSLPKAQHLPAPLDLQAAIPQVVQAADPLLRPLLAQQLWVIAESFDPPLRNATLNEMGRQLNLWNPLQWIQGWSSRGWMEGLHDKLEELSAAYPDLAILALYRDGIAQAEEKHLAMEQAEALRSLAQQVHPDFIPDP
ncbi:MAG: hypothetical protein NW237_14990 [Cyanobacteriota bacterium]|nr:hypothetical protein [Cyanobacteriota bacterium]